ncbi:MAG: Obg family GTPase CgtA, partial [Chloroflexota bacterium]|nr:Obg family GTPase CgtA [Chloroflexota bacterium]
IELYQADLAERPFLVAFNKVDLTEAQENLETFAAQSGIDEASLVPVSGVARTGLDDLVIRLARALKEAPAPTRFAPSPDQEILHPQGVDATRFEIRRKGSRTWQVYGPSIERMAVMTDVENEEGLRRLERELDRLGITRQLEEAGIEDGHLLRIGQVEIDWGDAL